jgi:hypothetical protein
MKRRILRSIPLVLIVLSTLISKAQIINSDFEDWSFFSDILMPDGWASVGIEGVAVPVTRTADSHSGTYAIKGEVMTTGLPAPLNILTPTLTSIPYESENLGFAVSERHYSMSGFYKFNPVEGDKFHIAVIMYHDTTTVGLGAQMIETGAIDYTPFNIDINYTSEEIPNICSIIFTICGPSGTDGYHDGSYYIVDELDFDTPVLLYQGFGDFNYQFALQQNYPNPFGSETEINFEIPETMTVKIKIFNILGQEISELADRKYVKGSHSIKWNGRDYNGRKVSNGIYFYQIQSGDLSQAKKMYLLR